VKLGLEGRKAIVTGGSKGLGFAIAQELLREGASVAICSRSEEEVLAAAAQLGREGPVPHAQRADVTDPTQVRDFVARSAEALGGVDCLVNNAGRAHPGTFETLTDADWSSDLDVKLFSLIRCCREVLPHLRAAGGGRIVNISAVTPQWDNIHRKRAPELEREEFFASLAAREVPLGRFGTPDEVSGLVAFLLGERASYITGASIDVAGGMGKYV
jgi:NAD(P)-dependent dehydrogenase (short-subunit alcohol dehydrogenase family)